MQATETSLYERLGGEAAIQALTQTFYQRVLDDPELRPFFQNTPMDKQQVMQHEFLSAALGGPVVYTGRSLAHAHQGRGIQTRHFAKFVRHILDALREMGVSQADADEVIEHLNAYSNEVTGKSY